MPVLRGGCHCGAVLVALETRHAAAALQPRACDCSFCRKHGAAWVSDGAGRLAVTARKAGGLREYRQGSGAARFLLCGACGVLVAVVFDTEAGVVGAMNAGCAGDGGFGAAVTVSPQQLSAADKQARWRTLWTPATIAAAPMPAEQLEKDGR